MPIGLTAIKTNTNVTLAGTLTQTGNVTVRVDVTDAYGCANGVSGRNYALTIAKAPLTVTVNNAVRNQGEANPPLTGSVTGQQNGDVITATFSTTATVNSAPGSYPITATLNDPGNRLSNYQVTNTPGTLTILNNCGITIFPFFATPGAVGQLYFQPLTASPMGTYTFSLLSGALPPGLQIVNNFGQYMLQGTPTTAGIFTFTILAKRTGSTCEAIRTYTMTLASTVVPFVNCTTLNANGSYTVWFGYENHTGAAVTIPVGANNLFLSGAQERGQTTVFQPGVVNNAFSVTFANAGAFTGWALKGPDGMLRVVVPSVLSPTCP